MFALHLASRLRPQCLRSTTCLVCASLVLHASGPAQEPPPPAPDARDSALRRAAIPAGERITSLRGMVGAAGIEPATPAV